VGPASSDSPIDEESLEKQILSELKKGDISVSSLAKELSKIFGIPKNSIYQKILEIKSTMDDPEENGKGIESDG
jgi:hypothetical protein